MTAIEFVQKKINPRITAEYDISLTGQQLFDLLDEYAAMQPETTERTAKAKYPIQMDGTYNKHVTYCSDCGTTVRNQLYCHHCGSKLICIE